MLCLDQIMKTRNIPDAELARLVGCNKGSINAWKTNRQQPRSPAIISLSRVLKCSSDEILGITPPVYGSTNALRHRELHRAVTNHGLYDSHTLHLWAAAFDKDSAGRFKRFSRWLRDVAEAAYKLELLSKPSEQIPYTQLTLF